MNITTIHLATRQQANRGNALIMTMVIMVAVAGLVLASAGAAATSLTNTVKRSYQQEAIAACSLILDTQEARIVRIGNTDPNEFVTGIDDNFGISYAAGIQVKWKIEPVRSANTGDDGASIDFIQNPRPQNTSAVAPIDGKEQTNDTKWLFRVAAQATVHGSDSESDQPLAEVQGARYVAVNKLPLFKYIIFYAQRGPKGDLELSHSGKAIIDGNVHTNGAMYLGPMPLPLSKDAVFGPSTDTLIGHFKKDFVDTAVDPDIMKDSYVMVLDGFGNPVLDPELKSRVVGVDGVFRLSKPLMFASINTFPMSGTGVAGRNWLPPQIYSTSSTLAPNETTGTTAVSYAWDNQQKRYIIDGDVLGSSIIKRAIAGQKDWTGDGTMINPYRILSNAGPIADAGLDGDFKRLINGVPIRGDGTYWNDSRNQGPSYTFKTDSLRKYVANSTEFRGFSGNVRSLQNGGSQVALPSLFASKVAPTSNPDSEVIAPVRPLEAQAIVPFNIDMDPSTDDQAQARPVFYDVSTIQNKKTTKFPSNDPIVEVPGTYLAYALGGDLVMNRIPPASWPTLGTGWQVTQLSNPSAEPKDNAKVGLTIRERPVPDTTIWPGSSLLDDAIVLPDTPRYLPYAYGKQWYPTVMPFRVADVSDNLQRNPNFAANAWLNINQNPEFNKVSYALGGTLVVTAANWPGNNRYDGGNQATNLPGNPTGHDHVFNNNNYNAFSTSSLLTSTYLDKYEGASNLTRPLWGGWDPNQNPDGAPYNRVRPYTGTFAGTNFNANTRTADGYNRLPYFYKDNWKFVHLQGMSAIPKDEAPATVGLHRTVIDDDLGFTSVTGRNEVSPWTLSAMGMTTVAIDNFSVNASKLDIINTQPYANGASVPYSIRWEGYLIPPDDGNYTLYLGPASPLIPGATSTAIRDGLRVWVLDRPDGLGALPVCNFLDHVNWRVPGSIYSSQRPDRSTWIYTDTGSVTNDRDNPATSATFPLGKTNTSRIVGSLGALSNKIAYPIIIDHYAMSANGSFAISWKKPNGTVEPIPSSALRARALGAGGFDVTKFKAVQAEIDISSLRSGPLVQKVGLMVRPAGGFSPELQGADPYVSLLFNPTRGLFSQRRMERAGHHRVTVAKYYIASGSGPSGTADTIYGNIIEDSRSVASVNRIATLRQREAMPRVDSGWYDGQYIDYAYPPTPAPLNGWNAKPTVYSGTNTKTVVVNGDAQTFTILDPFYVGTYNIDIKVRKKKRHLTRNYQTVMYELTNLDPNSYPGFRNGDHNSGILSIFNAATGTTRAANCSDAPIWFSMNYGQSGLSNGWWYKCNDFTTVPPAAPGYAAGPLDNFRVLGRGYYSGYGYYNDNASYWMWSPGPQPALDPITNTYGQGGYGPYVNYTIGSPTTIWLPLTGCGSPPAVNNAGLLPRVNWNGTIRTATLTDLQTITGVTFTSNASTEGTIYNNACTNAQSSVPNVLNADVPLANAPAQPNPSIADFSSPRTFSLTRNSSLIMDVNSYVSTNAKWYAPLARQFDPHPSNSSLWNPIALVGNWALTGGFRPDVWGGLPNNTLPPTSMTDIASGPAALVNGDANNWAGASPGDFTILPYTEGKYVDDLASVATDLNGTGKRLWMRLEHAISGLNSVFTLKYRVDMSPPSIPVIDTEWSTLSSYTIPTATFVKTPTGGVAQFLVGPCVQSGDYNNPTRAIYRGLRVETTDSIDPVKDASVWDRSITPKVAKYLASQYQVFWGQRDITETFFNYHWNGTTSSTSGSVNASINGLCASEEWFFQPREFWSQSRYWEHRSAGSVPETLVEKDVPNYGGGETTFTSTKYRELLSKTTALRLNMKVIQKFLQNTNLTQSVAKPMSSRSPLTPLPTITDSLVSRFNGLIYAARTNRYPWNPLSSQSSTALWVNPWSISTNPAYWFPNSGPPATNLLTERKGNDRSLPGATIPAPMLYNNVHLLQPYSLPPTTNPNLKVAPPCAPEDFHHGVMIAEASDIGWGYSPTNPKLSDSRTAIITPNALYLQGDLNSVKHQVKIGGELVQKVTPLAVMGDSVTMLSNAWRPESFQNEGLLVTPAGWVGGAGILGEGVSLYHGPVASSTSYNTAIVTNNLPTTKPRVMQGQAAPFIDTMLMLENWFTASAEMKFYGSLVVLDSRRYSRSYLLDQDKRHGTTPFGFTLHPAADPGWTSIFTAADVPKHLKPFDGVTPDWVGFCPQVYGGPTSRTFSFNEDLLTAEGTPPFTPFGITASGVGSWMRVMR